MDIKSIQQSLQVFADERDWNQFHNPKNLVMALLGEAGELVELFQWLTPEEAEAIPARVDLQEKVADELADIALYLIRLADKLDIDVERAIAEKMIKNAAKYPPEVVYGSAKKYNEY